MKMRELVAFLVAPASIPLALTLFTLVAGGAGALAFFAMAAMVCYAHAVLLGLPLYFLLRRHGPRPTSVIICSFLIGAMPAGGLFLYEVSSRRSSIVSDLSPAIGSALASAAGFGLFGAITGLVWLLIAGEVSQGGAEASL